VILFVVAEPGLRTWGGSRGAEPGLRTWGGSRGAQVPGERGPAYAPAPDRVLAMPGAFFSCVVGGVR